MKINEKEAANGPLIGKTKSILVPQRSLNNLNDKHKKDDDGRSKVDCASCTV